MLKAKSRRLTPQQSKLIDEFILCGVMQTAALAAGYTAEGARNIWRTFQRSQVQEEYQRRLDDEMTAKEVLHLIGRLARECPDPAVRTRNLEMIAKYHKLLTDKVEAAGPNGEPISIVFNLAPPK